MGDQPTDQQLTPNHSYLDLEQIQVLAQRIATALFRVKHAPIEEAQRLRMAEILLDEFELRAKWAADRPVFKGVGEGGVGEGATFTTELPIGKIDRAQKDHSFDDFEDAGAEPHLSQFGPLRPPSDSPALCPTCFGATEVCLRCQRTKSYCKCIKANLKHRETESLYDPVVCDTCGGSGKDPASV